MQKTVSLHKEVLEKLSAPQLRRTETACCYHCFFSETDLRFWKCFKHKDIVFGDAEDGIQETLSNMAELVCDDFTAENPYGN